jgi:hypothetical protein
VRNGHRPVPADGDDGIQAQLLAAVERPVAHVFPAPVAEGIGRVGRPQHGAALGEDAAGVAVRHGAHVALDHAAKAVLEAEDLRVALQEEALGERADGRVEAGAVAAPGEQTDSHFGKGGSRGKARLLFENLISQLLSFSPSSTYAAASSSLSKTVIWS